jgi:HSP20 family protein
MALVQYAPWPELDAMERRMRRFLGDAGLLATVAAADVYETEGEFVLELEAPGYEQKDLAIELTDHMLVVKGSLEATKEEDDKAYRLRERLESSFQRRFELPSDLDLDRFEASFEQGVLKVRAPRLEKVEPKRIDIGVKA